jgi:hypothetical protein
MGFGLVIGFIALFDVAGTTLYSLLLHTYRPVSVVKSSLLLLGSGLNDRRSLSSGFPNYPRHQLSASNRNTSDRLNPSSPLISPSHIQSYVTTDGQLACLHIKPHIGPKTRFFLLSDSCGFVMWGALSEQRKGLSLAIVAGPRHCSHFQARVPQNSPSNWPSWINGKALYFYFGGARVRIYFETNSDCTSLNVCLNVNFNNRK